jgi:hypothetical protein
MYVAAIQHKLADIAANKHQIDIIFPGTLVQCNWQYEPSISPSTNIYNTLNASLVILNVILSKTAKKTHSLDETKCL